MPRTLEGLPSVGYENLTISTTAVALTASKYDRVPPAIGAIVTVDTAPIRWTKDGTTPTSTTGHFAIPTGDPILLLAADLVKFSAIRQSTTDASLRVTYVGAG